MNKLKSFDLNILKKFIDMNIINFNEVMSLGTEAIMQTIIDRIHKYKITKGKGKDTRFVTSIPDSTKPRGTRQVRANTLTEMYNILLEFYGVTQKSSITFEELFSKWVEYKKLFIGKNNKGLSESTIKRFKRDFQTYFANTELAKMPIVEIKPAQLEETFSAIILNNGDTTNKNISKRHDSMYEQTFKNLFGYVSGAFVYAIKNDYLDKDPCMKLDKALLLTLCTPNNKKVDEDRILNYDQIDDLKESLKQHQQEHPYYMPTYAIELALLTGMRVGELAALHWSDIHSDHINIDYSEHRIDYLDRPCELIIAEPKNRKHRKFPITPEIQELLDKIKSLEVQSDFIFARKNGERFTAHDISCACARRGLDAGIEHVSIHRIRRTVSSVLNTLMARETVANLLGHLETTNERYYDYDVTNKEDKIIALSAFVSRMNQKSGHKKNTRTA